MGVGVGFGVGFGDGLGLGCTVELLISNWLQPSQPHKQMVALKLKSQLVSQLGKLVNEYLILVNGVIKVNAYSMS